MIVQKKVDKTGFNLIGFGSTNYIITTQNSIRLVYTSLQIMSVKEFKTVGTNLATVLISDTSLAVLIYNNYKVTLSLNSIDSNGISISK